MNLLVVFGLLVAAAAWLISALVRSARRRRRRIVRETSYLVEAVDPSKRSEPDIAGVHSK